MRYGWTGFDLQSRVADGIQVSVAKISRTETGELRLAREAAGQVNHGETGFGCEDILRAIEFDELPKGALS